MIAVDRIHKRVQDLSAKNRAGYISADEFNRNLRDSENLLFAWYWNRYQESKSVEASLNPFLEEKRKLVSNSFSDHPTDLRYLLHIFASVVDQSCEKVTEQLVPCDQLLATEVSQTLSSVIRRPSLENRLFRYENYSGRIKVHPTEFKGQVLFKYLRHPNYGEWNYELDIESQQEVYNASTSQNLEWNEQDESNIIDLMLLFKGIQIRETELINWVSAKKQLSS